VFEANIASLSVSKERHRSSTFRNLIYRHIENNIKPTVHHTTCMRKEKTTKTYFFCNSSYSFRIICICIRACPSCCALWVFICASVCTALSRSLCACFSVFSKAAIFASASPNFFLVTTRSLEYLSLYLIKKQEKIEVNYHNTAGKSTSHLLSLLFILLFFLKLCSFD
jgi:hypothetical protein